MRTLFGKILLWFWCTLAITVAGSVFIAGMSMTENDSDLEAPMSRLVTFQLDEARTAYETGGKAALHEFLDRLKRVYNANGVLTDGAGHDLLTGQDRSGLLRKANTPSPYRIFFRMGKTMVARRSEDGRYWFVFFLPPRKIVSWFLMPEHLFVLAVAVLLCYWLALHLTSPVRKLQRAVERFGRGDLSARVGSTRADELGQLARTFDRMAERTETLMTAERRLLLDISHELRSPLARLGVAVELARSGDDLEANLDRIQKESDRLNALVGQLLQVTRAEGDPASLRHEPVRLDELLEELVDESRIEAVARGCEVELKQHDPVTVEGDTELLRRAVENVIRNAIRYSPKDTAVEVSLARSNGTAVVGIRDHGPGVPEEALPQIFEAFYRVETDRNRASGGIGLGLSLARRAVELHHGRIRAKNAHPGLEVEVQLPAKSA